MHDRQLSDIFRIARIILSHRELWTQKAQAKNFLGRPVRPLSSAAVRWDVEGAVALALGGPIPMEVLQFLDSVSSKLYGSIHPFEHEKALWAHGVLKKDLEKAFKEMTLERVVEVNDTLGYDAVMCVLDKAIELALEAE